MIESKIKKLRDPFILVENGIYYAYGTGVPDNDNWDDTVYACYKNTSGSLSGDWSRITHRLYVDPQYAVKNHWAPRCFWREKKPVPVHPLCSLAWGFPFW